MKYSPLFFLATGCCAAACLVPLTANAEFILPEEIVFISNGEDFSNEPNAQGWSLISVEGKGNLRNVIANVDTGTQQIVIRFDPSQLQPEIIRRERRRAAKPGQKPDGEPVQELMKHLDQELLNLFETLTPTKQEEFRQSLTDYADAYPDSSDELRSSFVRRKLKELRSEAEEEASEPKVKE